MKNAIRFFGVLLILLGLASCDYEQMYSGVVQEGVIDIDDKLSSAGYYRDKYRLDIVGSCTFTVTSKDDILIIFQHYNASDIRVGTETTSSTITFTETMNAGDHFYIAVYQNNQDWADNGYSARYSVEVSSF